MATKKTKLPEYPLDETERDIQAKDFPEGGIYHTLVKHCGPQAAVILAEYCETKTAKLTLRSYGSIIKKALDRKVKNKFKG